MRLSGLLRGGKFTEDNPLMGGPGGRMSQNRKMQGMTIQSLKHHYALVPLFVIMGAGLGWVAYFSWRSLTKMSDIAWKHQSEPYNTYQYQQTKFLNPGGVDYKKAGETIPKYKE